MERNRGVLRAIVIAALLIAAGHAVSAGGGRWDIKPSAVIGRDSRLLAVQGVAVLPDGAVLVADKLDYRVKRFAPSGRQTAAVGGRGRGPGQFQGPGPLDVHGGRIAVADFASGRVQYLRGDLTALVSFQVPGAVSDLCFDGGGNLWVMALTEGDQPGLYVYDDRGRQRKAVRLRNAAGEPFLRAGFVAWLGKGIMAVSYFVQNKIELWDTSGKFIREFSVPGLPGSARTISGSRPGLTVPDGNLFRSMTADGHGRVYLLGADYCDNPGREVLEMDGRGTFRRRLVLAGRCVLIRADRAGSLYVVPHTRDSVIRYRLAGE